MRSKASIRGHPIHPALISFPLAFLIGGFFFDLAGTFSLHPSLWVVGYYLCIAGVGTALLAAIPGFIDYFFTVPPHSSGKSRATIHMAANLTVVAIYTIAWIVRSDAGSAPPTLSLVLEGVGTCLLGISGWLGGTLVTRNMISVDHLYAGAGQWQEEAFHAAPGAAVAVARSNELRFNQMKLLHVNGRRIVLGRTEEGYVAFDDGCTHHGGSLADGVMICGTVQCPWHGSQFDTLTGAVKGGPARKAIQTYSVDEEDGKILLRLDSKVFQEEAASKA
jgi:nitrite reductase/ring-hydroxylating ferredoxin subunit/uncharacterized membrane protein